LEKILQPAWCQNRRIQAPAFNPHCIYNTLDLQAIFLVTMRIARMSGARQLELRGF
jgi:hypothetical protein